MIKQRGKPLCLRGAALRKEFLVANAICEKKNSFLREQNFARPNEVWAAKWIEFYSAAPAAELCEAL